MCPQLSLRVWGTGVCPQLDLQMCGIGGCEVGGPRVELSACPDGEGEGRSYGQPDFGVWCRGAAADCPSTLGCPVVTLGTLVHERQVAGSGLVLCCRLPSLWGVNGCWHGAAVSLCRPWLLPWRGSAVRLGGEGGQCGLLGTWSLYPVLGWPYSCPTPLSRCG